MIFHIFTCILMSILYIHLYSSPSAGILRSHNVTSSQLAYRRGHGFESRSGLNFFYDSCLYFNDIVMEHVIENVKDFMQADHHHSVMGHALLKTLAFSHKHSQ